MFSCKCCGARYRSLVVSFTLGKVEVMERVLEIGQVAAGYCGRMFAHAGADVVRVSVAASPTWVSEQAMSLYLHAGKRHVETTDVSLIGDLAARADVVICEASTADELLELGFDNWRAPVKLALTPFGRTGPKRNWRATTNVILAMGGYTNLMGDADKAPLSLPGHYVEFQTAAMGYAAANACRLAGQSNEIDVSMLETLMALSQFTTVRWHCTGELRTRHGSDFWFVVPSNLFACRDGWIYLNIVPAFWDPVTVFLSKPELLVDERFVTNDSRMANRDALHEIAAAALAELTKADIEARAEACRIPLGVVQTFDDVLADKHLAERDFWQQIVQPDGSLVKSPSLPYRINHAARNNWSPQESVNAAVVW